MFRVGISHELVHVLMLALRIFVVCREITVKESAEPERGIGMNAGRCRVLTPTESVVQQTPSFLVSTRNFATVEH